MLGLLQYLAMLGLLQYWVFTETDSLCFLTYNSLV
jgi:hypothetical protein